MVLSTCLLTHFASLRVVLTFRVAGSTGSGKSYLMLQALDYAQATGYVVIYVPRGMSTRIDIVI